VNLISGATMSDRLDDFIEAAATALALPLEAAWKPAVKANLEVTLKHAATVAEFRLPDDAEPAPIFKA
jgi:1-carboxybiuret hydrolase subunit AtzG-like